MRKQLVEEPTSHLKITICVSLIVTLFFAFRAEAASTPAVAPSNVWSQPDVQEKWQTVEDVTFESLQAVSSLGQVAAKLKDFVVKSCFPSPDSTLGVSSVYYNNWVKSGVPEGALKKALAYEKQDPHRGDRDKEITNKEWMTIIDYTAPSAEPRMFVLNLKTGEMIKSLVAHGKGSDDGRGDAIKFSNKDSSLESSPGFIKISDHIVSPSHGPAFKLEGLENRNSEVASRQIILHSASYVSDEYVKEHGMTGRSWGCPAVSKEMLKVLYSKNIPGSLLYGYTAEDARLAQST